MKYHLYRFSNDGESIIFKRVSLNGFTTLNGAKNVAHNLLNTWRDKTRGYVVMKGKVAVAMYGGYG